MGRNSSQLTIALHSPFKFNTLSSGGLRLSLMHNLTDFSYYIIILIYEDLVELRYITTILFVYNARCYAERRYCHGKSSVRPSLCPSVRL